MRLSLWPHGLIGRVGLVLFAAVLLAVIGSTLVFEQAEKLSGGEIQAWRVADQLQAASRVLSVTDADRRMVVADALSVLDLSLQWGETDQGRVLQGQGPVSRRLREDMLEHEPALAAQDLRLHAASEVSDKTFDGDLRLEDGSVLRFRVQNLRTPVPAIYAQLGSVAIFSICVLGAALLLVRTLADPLERLVQATDAIGHGPAVAMLARGPREVRRVARAFNAMQQRIDRLIQSRTEALAAVSHDLRTPISRLQLRAGFLPSEEDRRAFETDLGEMEAMVTDLLDYLGGEADPEKPRRTNLAAIVMTLVDAASDAGHAVSYRGPDRLILDVRPLGIKRALSNIINNAVAYGDTARVALAEAADVVTITINDDGPGIPEDAREAVFEPFHRLESSRNRDTGGTGLGLTIARQAVARERGSITLANRAEGGLTVTVVLPK